MNTFENIMENGAFAPFHPHKVLSVLSKVCVHLLGYVRILVLFLDC